MMTSHPHSASMGLPSGFRRDAPRTDRDPIWTSPRYYNYVRDMMSGFSRELKLRRLLESEANPDRNPVPQDLQPLSVEVTEFYVRQNAASHHTEAYELTSMCPAGGERSGQGQQGGSLRGSPVLRRGQDFFFAVRFDRAPEYKTDAIRLIFSFGPNPQSTKGTRAVLPVPLEPRANGGSKKDSWEASVQRKEGKTLILEVRIPSTAPVGIWRCSVECERGMSRFRRGAEGAEGESNQGPPPQLARREHRCDVDIYILFNPWCKEDGVYMEEEWQRKEYVESDSGKVWVGGSFRQPVGRRWVFGQFEDVVLPATMCLLELSRLRHEERGDPVRVSRAVSAVVNSVDDDGLLVGRWHGDYKDGHAPTAWTGSVAILEEYLRSGGQSVRYGQCWVFSALTVTLCRALGIPCRSVTNFVSAHDGNQTLCVERYFDQSGCEMLDHECSGDSLWNFHTWNDAWMSRPDLPPGYGGWQAIDATPQEQSEKMMQCGPAPLAAVRSGQVGFAFDTAFVFAEVNADVVHFQEDPDSPWGFSRLKVDQYHVGRRIVTKNPKFDDDFGDNDLEDITDQYKNPEGSMGERLATFSALQTAGSARGYFGFPEDALPEDVCFSLEELDSVPYGESFSVKVKIQNKSGEKRSISAVLSVHSVRYTGAPAHRIKTSSVEFEMQPLSDETMVLRVSPKEYLQRVDRDHCLLKMNAIAHVAQTKQSWSEEDDFCLRKPRFNVQVTGTPRVGAECTVVLSFQNPLTEVPLTNCTLSVEGPGLQRPRISRQRDVKPGELVTLTERFYPRKSGQRRIVATFDSQELAEITGSAAVTVAD